MPSHASPAQETLWQRHHLRPHQLALLLVLIAGALLRISGIFVPMFPDESTTTIQNITQFLRDRTIIPVDVIYPTLYSYLAAMALGAWSVLLILAREAHSLAGTAMLFITDQAPLLAPMRLLTVAIDVGTIVTVYFLGRRLRDAWTGVAAALFVALSQNHLHYARWALPDALMALCATLCLLAALRLMERPTLRWYLIGGALAGLTITSKFNGGTALVALLMAHCLAQHEAGGPLRPANLGKLSAAAGVCVAVFLAGSPVWLLKPAFCVETFRQTMAHMAGGHYYVPGGPPYLWALKYLTLQETTLGVLALLGCGWAAFQRRRPEWVLLTFILVTALIIGRWQKQSPHYLLGIWPALLTLGAVMLRDLSKKFRRPQRALAVAVLLTAVLPAGRAATFAREELRTDNRLFAEQWIQQNIPAGARIAMDWSYMPALYDINWMREATVRRRTQLGDSPDIAIWNRFVERTRAYDLVPMQYEVDWFRRTDAEYAITSSDCHDRFLTGARPPPNHPFYAGFRAREEFYRTLLSNRGPSRFRLVREFKEGGGPRIFIFKAAPPTQPANDQ